MNSLETLSELVDHEYLWKTIVNNSSKGNPSFTLRVFLDIVLINVLDAITFLIDPLHETILNKHEVISGHEFPVFSVQIIIDHIVDFFI